MTSLSNTVPQLAGGESNARNPVTQRTSRRRPNKPMTAERRMQNCRSQRAYRQRKQERLKALEAKVASLESGHEVEPVPRHPLATPLAIPASNSLRIEGSTSSPAHVTSIAIDSSQPYNFSSGNYDASIWLDHLPPTSLQTETMPLPQISSNADLPMVSETHSTESFSALLHDTNTGAFSSIQTQGTSIPTTTEISDTTAVAASLSSLHSIGTSASMYSTPRPRVYKEMHIYRPSSKPLLIKPQLIRKWFQSLSQSTRRLLAQLAKDGDFSFVDMISSLLLAEMRATNSNGQTFEGSDPEKTESRLLEMRFAMSPTASYSPYRNVLRIARFSYFAALFTNFSCLGFDFGLVLDERSLSPFCTRTPTEDTISSTDTWDANIPPSLRPIPSQYTVPHHPYLDSLPFPTFRRRALAALAADPPLLEEDDLCIDLMVHDGLVCWGSASQNGMDHGTPWDSHSWEGKEWFLRKWKWLLGQESELWHSSRWWAAQRGEYISLRD